MARYMITHSLLSSWLYSMKENPYEDAESTADPMADFLRVLRREPTETTEAMQKGIDFENLVTEIVTGRFCPEWKPSGGIDPNTGEALGMMVYPKWFDAANKVAGIIGSGLLQVPESKTVEIGGMEIFLYGRLDALSAGKIYDIKFSGSYGRGNYIDSTQHPMYLELVPEAQSFVYIISNGTEVWTEEYRREELITPITYIASDFLEWLSAMDLMELFKEKWLAL